MRNEMRERTEKFCQKFEARNNIIMTLVKSAGKIKDLVANRALEIHKGFGKLTGDLPQIDSRIQELESFVSDTNSMVVACVQQARDSCEDYVAAEEIREFDHLWGEGSSENDKGVKLSFT